MFLACEVRVQPSACMLRLAHPSQALLQGICFHFHSGLFIVRSRCHPTYTHAFTQQCPRDVVPCSYYMGRGWKGVYYSHITIIVCLVGEYRQPTKGVRLHSAWHKLACITTSVPRVPSATFLLLQAMQHVHVLLMEAGHDRGVHASQDACSGPCCS